MRDWSVIFNSIIRFLLVKGLVLPVLGKVVFHDGEVNQVKQAISQKWSGYFQVLTVYPINSMNPFSFQSFHYHSQSLQVNFSQRKGWWRLPSCLMLLLKSFCMWDCWWLISFRSKFCNFISEKLVKLVKLCEQNRSFRKPVLRSEEQ